MASGEDDYEWQPPSEAEMKILQAKRERSNRISKLMGDYLLKGYKMLGISCSDCGTILLQDKQKRNYCVTCTELASDTGKDDPALNNEAARRQVAEERQRQVLAASSTSPEPEPGPMQTSAPFTNGILESSWEGPAAARRSPLPRGPKRSISDCSPPIGQASSSGVALSHSNPGMHVSQSSPAVAVQAQSAELRASVMSLATAARLDMTESLAVVQGKLSWATYELQRTGSVEASIQLCHLIKMCAETLSSLHSVHGKDA